MNPVLQWQEASGRGQEARGLGILDAIWWVPDRIAIFDKRWVTIRYPQYTANVRSWQTVAVSPLDVSGKAHFVAWDIDSSDYTVVKRLLKALPKGCYPLVSVSGRRGYHVWMFPDSPIPAQRAVAFAKAVGGVCGIREFFPSSQSTSRCLKWLQSLHPLTGEREEFIAIEKPSRVLDTRAVLEALASGMFRTPEELVSVRYLLHKPKPLLAQGQSTQAPRTPSMLDRLAKEEHLVAWLMQLGGRTPVPVGKGFRCFLPQHEETHPSASFWRSSDGRILYHDWHSRDGAEWLSLGEVYAALRTGQVRKLKAHESAVWLARAGIDSGLVPNNLFGDVEQASLLFESWAEALNNKDIYVYVVWDTATKLRRVFEFFTEHAKVMQVCGLPEIPASARFIAQSTGLKVWEANRAANLLAVLGFIRKIPRPRGDRWQVLTPSLSDVQARWQALGCPSLENFNAMLVGQRLGEATARAVFHRIHAGERG
ncbi:MAG: TOTE conflict system archaeo-eukaryotic primase domain-containing protein [Bacillota bacterium]